MCDCEGDISEIKGDAKDEMKEVGLRCGYGNWPWVLRPVCNWCILEWLVDHGYVFVSLSQTCVCVLVHQLIEEKKRGEK